MKFYQLCILASILATAVSLTSAANTNCQESYLGEQALSALRHLFCEKVSYKTKVNHSIIIDTCRVCLLHPDMIIRVVITLLLCTFISELHRRRYDPSATKWCVTKLYNIIIYISPRYYYDCLIIIKRTILFKC